MHKQIIRYVAAREPANLRRTEGSEDQPEMESQGQLFQGLNNGKVND